MVLISTYDLGRQPFGLASPAAWLREAGAEVTCLDLSVERLEEDAVAAADLVAFYLPMHTAARIAARVVARVRALNSKAHLCFYGLYAPVNETYLRALGAGTILGGEYESGLLSLVKRLVARPNGKQAGVPQSEPVVSLAKQQFLRPDRSGLPPLAKYACLQVGEGPGRIVGYTEASRGCKHLCRHCPVVPVYRGRFRVVQQEIVLEDIRQQVAAGAEHITFGDPDFFNGVGHALALVTALHQEHPRLTYDVTIKIEHLLRHQRHLRTLRDTGCLLVTSAVESIDDRVLAILDKGHTRSDFIHVVRLFDDAGLILNPTFVAFTPWISIDGYRELLALLAELGLVEHIAPIQLAIRLLIPAGSRLLELPEVREMVERFDEKRLVHNWRHKDPRVDRLQGEIQSLVQASEARHDGRRETFSRVRRLADQTATAAWPIGVRAKERISRAAIPYLTEPWYC